MSVDATEFRIDGSTFEGLQAIATDANGGLDKASAKPLMKALNRRLEELQELLYAKGSAKVLVVLQATDTGGKDGTIRAVFDGTNPQGVKVHSFKKPTDEELSRDYLWRIHQHVPAKGEIALFNRSHYEDVLVVRVHDFVEEELWRKRYGHIRDFERMLTDEGVTIVKFYLHISKDEQRQRLQDRIDNPEKHWKFSKSDLAERQHWDEYQVAFEEMLKETSTDNAPWYAIPADRKWFRNVLITKVLVDTLEGLVGEPFESNPDLEGLVIE